MTTTRVQGTSNAQDNVQAIQNAVDQGGTVILEGTFPFDVSPSPPPSGSGSRFSRMVTISKDVTIVGHNTPTIQGGHIPFRIEALDCSVTIQGLRFISPASQAISVCAVKGLLIADCRIEGIRPAPSLFGSTQEPNAVAVAVHSSPRGGMPASTDPGKNISGPLTVINNEIEVGADSSVNTVGMAMFSAGESGGDKEVDIRISGNKIRNVSARAINLRHIGGRALVALNEIETGTISVPPDGNLPDAIHALGSGSYLIAHNSIVCEWASGAGVRVHSRTNLNEAVARAIVTQNDVIMRAPASARFNPNSAGIAVSGWAEDISVQNNRIKGRARAALAVEAEGGTAPANTRLVLNDLAGFHPSPRGILVHGQPQPTNTLLVIRQTDLVLDEGLSTQIVTV